MKFEPYAVFIEECNKHLDWNRLVVNRGEQLMLDSSGYIVDFWDQHQEFRLPDTGCITLLGEPGSGKSAVLYSSYKLHREHAIWMDLAHCFSVEDIYGLRELPQVHHWIESITDNLKIFIDNFDLCRMERSAFAEDFMEWLYSVKEHHLRLSIVIASRTFAWSHRFEGMLTSFFDAQADAPRMQTFELAPLRYQDIERWARQFLDDENQSTEFLVQLEKLHMQPFAMKPLTLKMLLNEYKKAQVLPQSVTDLYALGCETLCSDGEPHGTATFTPKQLLAVSSKLAAVHLFCAKDLSTAISGFDDDCVSILDLVDTQCESFRGQSCSMSVEAIEAALATALFSAGGQARFRFSHQAYAEFLAAQLLIEKYVPIEQLDALLFNSRDPARRLVPSLQGVAAWLSSTNDNVFDTILDRDPMALFLMNFDTVDVVKKPRIVDAYVRWVARTQIPLHAPRAHYANLVHEQLHGQLARLLSEFKEDDVRFECLLIAKQCKPLKMAPLLEKIVNDAKESLQVRVAALDALTAMPGGYDPQTLKKFVTKSQAFDERDDLKGLALSALFPNHLSAKVVFSHLSVPKHENLFSYYSSFLLYVLPERLTEAQLPVALDWCIGVTAGKKSSTRFEWAIDRIFLRAITFVANSEIAVKLGKLAVLRLSKRFHLIDSIDRPKLPLALDDDDKRRQLLKSMFSTPLPSENSRGIGVSAIADLVRRQDFAWLYEQLRGLQDEKWKLTGVDILRRLYTEKYSEYWDVVIMKENLELTRMAFGTRFDYVEFGTEQESEARASYEQVSKWFAAEEKKLLDPPPAERIRHYLNLSTAEISERVRWWNLTRELTLEPYSERYDNFRLRDIRDLPGWKVATPETRNLLLEAAERFICSTALTEEEAHTAIAEAGYKALALIFNEGRLGSIKVDWPSWCEALLTVQASSPAEKQLARQLISIAYHAGPDQFLSALKKVINAEASRSAYLFVTDLLDAELKVLLAPWFIGLLDETGLSASNVQ